MFANGLAVLNNERFLEKSTALGLRTCLLFAAITKKAPVVTYVCAAVGWGYSQLHGGNGIGPGPGAFKQQTIGLLHAMTYMQRTPLALPSAICACTHSVTAEPNNLVLWVQCR